MMWRDLRYLVLRVAIFVAFSAPGGENGRVCYMDEFHQVRCSNDTSGITECRLEIINGFLKTQCQYNGTQVLKCVNSEVFYQVYEGSMGIKEQKYTATCQDDPQSYQVCGSTPVFYQSFGPYHLCESFVCGRESGNYINMKFLCNGKEECEGGRDEMGCYMLPRNTYTCKYLGTPIPREKVCNGIYDCLYADDEDQNCNHTTGLTCEDVYGRTIWAHPAYICSHLSELIKCADGEHVRDCDVYKGGRWCNNSVYNRPTLRYIKPLQMCHPTEGRQLLDYTICSDGRDQVNCSEASLVCPMSGFRSTISQWGVCRGYGLCDDGLDDLCLEVEHGCTLHKHQLCDGRRDCPRGLDETGHVCREVTSPNVTCRRKFSITTDGGGRDMRIPKTWLCDGIEDCEGGMDEDVREWKVCGTPQTQERCVEREEPCGELFRCPGHSYNPRFSDMDSLCDYVEECPRENEICRRSRGGGSTAIFDRAIRREGIPVTSPASCLPGLRLPGVATGDTCRTVVFAPFGKEVFGVTLWNVILPLDVPWSCKSVYGEVYVYLACTGLCPDATCPLKPLLHNSCPYLPGRAITMTTDRQPSCAPFNLTVIQKPKHTSNFTDQIFECDNGVCVSFEKVCNLGDECGDGSDEVGCANNFQCGTTSPHSSSSSSSSSSFLPSNFIPLSAVCDGKLDCEDGSDECNERCTSSIIQSRWLRGVTWVFGISATVINTYVLLRKGTMIKSSKGRSSLYNSIFVLVIAVGDLLTGIYLMGIAIADVINSDGYCRYRFHWLNSAWCMVLGVTASIGSLTSLFTMALLSSYRFYSIRHVFASRSVTRKSAACMIVTLVAMGTCVTVISFVPIMGRYENYFLNGIFYPGNLLFVGAPSKSQHIEVLEVYYGRLSSKNRLQWNAIRELVGGMFTHDTTGIHGNDMSFYGNAGVCVFKYFVTPNDPQHVFSLAVLTFNTILCGVVVMSYTGIYLLSRQTMGSLSSSRDSGARGSGLERKISLIILTDFLSWMPFIGLCVLHYLEVYDGTPHYELFSLLVLPVNSVINPIIYDDTIGSVVRWTRDKVVGDTHG